MGTLFVVGIVVAILFVLAGTGVAVLLFAWLRHVWRDLRQTPVFGAQVARGANLARPVIAYRDVLSRAPVDATNLTLRIQRKVMALESVKEELGTEQRFRVEETTRRYLPDTMNAYRKAVAASEAEQRAEASRMLIEQLTRLDANLDGIAAGASQSALAALQANGHFLDELSAEVTGADQGLPDKQTKPH